MLGSFFNLEQLQGGQKNNTAHQDTKNAQSLVWSKLPDMVEKLGAAQQQVLEHWRQTQEELSAKQEEHEQELKQLTDKGQQMQALQAANNDLSRKLKLVQQEVAVPGAHAQLEQDSELRSEVARLEEELRLLRKAQTEEAERGKAELQRVKEQSNLREAAVADADHDRARLHSMVDKLEQELKQLTD